MMADYWWVPFILSPQVCQAYVGVIYRSCNKIEPSIDFEQAPHSGHIPEVEGEDTKQTF